MRTTTTTSTSTVSPRQALPERPMVCTVGTNLRTPLMIPEDGLCDYLFYDSIFKDNRNVLVNPKGFENDMKIFAGNYRKFKQTAFGIGFAFKKAHILKENLRAAGPLRLEYFWSRGIYHFGILDTPTLRLSQSEVEVAFECLKALDSLAQVQRRAGHPSFIFFAMVVLNITWEAYYWGKFQGYYQPDLVIAQGHYYYGDNTFAECRVMPPTALSRPPEASNSYQHDLTMAVNTFRKLTILGKPTLWAISVTMKGRWTMPLPGSTFEFLSRCVNNYSAPSFDTYTEVCRHQDFKHQFKYNKQQGAVLVRHIKERLLFAYDNEDGLCQKLCKVQALQAAKHFGIVAFDLDYEDFSNYCPTWNKYGNFSRLRTLRRILDFFRTEFKTEEDEDACLRLVS
ncbi:uncharacterized protein LOC144100099 [Amblyomma americanum]